MGALTGTAAGLCAGTCFFHLPPLGKRRLVHCLQAETFPLTFVKCLRQKKEMDELVTEVYQGLHCPTHH